MSTRTVGKEAFTFNAPLQMQAGVEDDTAKVSLFARQADPIDHWYWGPIVHDFSGMKHKATIPMDWNHRDEIGFIDEFSTDDKGLTCGGHIVPFKQDDKASEIIFRGKKGVPYEASIDWSGGGTRIEEVEFGKTAEVNGKEFNGPLTVVREWSLKAVAVCKFGADEGTQTSFSKEAEQFEVTVTSEEKMTTDTKAPEVDDVEDKQDSVEVEAPETDIAPEVTEPKQDSTPEDKPDGKKFIEAFGDKGAVWFVEGLTFEDALQRFNKELQDELKEANDKLSAAEAGMGSSDAVDTGDAEGTKAKGLEQFIRIRK